MYTPHTDDDIAEMLSAIGVGSLAELVRVPPDVEIREPIALAAGICERDLNARFSALSARNTATGMRSFLGAGAYRHYVPPVIASLAMRGEFLTAYTPYQAEVSQGYLQAIYEWQTYITLLTGLDVANASVYDGATALAEAIIMAVNATGRTHILLSAGVPPQYRTVVATYAAGIGLTLEDIPLAASGLSDTRQLAQRCEKGDIAACVLASPNFFGCIDQPSNDFAQQVNACGSLLIGVVPEAISLGALTPPGDWGADIAVGEGQSFGVALAYGGPYVGFLACKEAHMRRIPGRLVGRTLDIAGNPAYTLTLQAREQHIRRERATSNICTNQAHCALIATIYLAAMGEQGLRDCATHNLQQSRALAAALSRVPGVTMPYTAPYFNEFVLHVPQPAVDVLAALEREGILGGVALSHWYPDRTREILVTATEMTTDEDIVRYADALGAILGNSASQHQTRRASTLQGIA